MSGLNNRRSIYDSPARAAVYLAPGLLVYLLFFLVPVARTVMLSFFRWDGLSTRVFFGMGNYLTLLKDEKFMSALAHNGILVLFLMVLPTIIGLLLATIIEGSRIPGNKIFEVAFFMPQVLSLVVVGVIWKWIYNPTFGVINAFLRALGLDFLARGWLGDSKTALGAVGLTGSWVNYGFAMIIFLAGYTRIPVSLYESASIDGANSWRKFFNISIPGLHREIMVVGIYLFISSLKTFDLVYVMTRGGPGFATNVISLYVFKNAFQYNRLGYAAAMAISLALIIFVVSFSVARISARRGADG